MHLFVRPVCWLALLTSASVSAQVAPAASNINAPKFSTPAGDAIVLTPFEVNSDKDDGFSATNAGTATKLGLDMKDMAAPYTVMTGEFIEALGITNLQDAALWSTNGGPVIDAQGADQFAVPSMYNIRGVTLNAGQQRNFFTTASIGDTYNAERIDFGRGPNAVLFNTGANSVLGGGISLQTKRARVDRSFENIGFTVGSWDYYRSTLDVNRQLTDKLAVRANTVWQDKGGWFDHEFEKIKGLTVAGTYRIAQKTELRVEVINEKVARTRPTFPSFDRLSGWDGVTVFDGPITNAMLSTTATPGAVYGLTFSGEPNGIERVGNDYVYIPGQGTIMNWTNTARTRRGDSTARVPIYSGGQVWTRNGNAELLSFGNWATQQRPATPSVTQNGDQVPFRYAESLPDDRFDRAIARSGFRPPNKRFTNVPDDPLYTQWTNSASVGFTHQIGERLYFETAANYNSVHEKIVNNINGFRDSFLDLNRMLPNGQPNPHFLDVYGQGQERIRERWIDNGGVRANLNYILNAGKWGNYTFNLTGAMSQLNRDNRQRVATVALATDPREWQGQAISIRNYWNEPNRTFEPASGLPMTLFNRVPAADGNSFTTTTRDIGTHWVLNDWGDEREVQKQVIFAMAGRYFGDRLVVSGGARQDNWTRKVRSRLNGFGFMPSNPTWDGFALDDRYWRPDAPADWKNLTYIPRNPDGTPRSATPIQAIDRPTIAGVNGVNLPNPLYANDRFRNDYNAPERKGSGLNTSLGVVYHLFSWVTAGANYGDSYRPRTGGEFTLDGGDAEPETGVAYDGVLRFSLFKRRLDLSTRYYFNRQENILGTPPTTAPINDLLSRNDATDNTPEGRNQLGFQNVPGGDYFARKNSGIEIEISGRITRGWRMTGSFGTGRVDDYERWTSTQAYVMGRRDEFRQVLERAGGILDTTRKPDGAPSAPGLAIADPARPDATIGIPSERTNAIINYNNLWFQYDSISQLKDTIGIKRMTAKIFTDYTVQEGRLKGLRFGVGANYVDRNLAGYRSGDTVANPNFNAALPVTAANRPWMDDPSVDLNTPVWIEQPFEITGTLGYTLRLKSRSRMLDGKEVVFNLVIRNLMNWQKVIAQDEGVTLRPPGGDFSVPYRVAVPGRIGMFQKPINFELTTTLKL
jgi:hypothetical protein